MLLGSLFCNKMITFNRVIYFCKFIFHLMYCNVLILWIYKEEVYSEPPCDTTSAVIYILLYYCFFHCIQLQTKYHFFTIKFINMLRLYELIVNQKWYHFSTINESIDLLLTNIQSLYYGLFYLASSHHNRIRHFHLTW